MEQVKVLLEQAKTLLYEVENNVTIQENWKVGMNVAIDYILTNAFNRLFDIWKEKQSSEILENPDVISIFYTEICYDNNDKLNKQLETLEKFFNSL